MLVVVECENFKSYTIFEEDLLTWWILILARKEINMLLKKQRKENLSYLQTSNSDSKVISLCLWFEGYRPKGS